MDTGKFTCNICGGKIRVDLDMCGDTIACPHCSNSILVPLTGMSEGMQISRYVLKKRVGLGAMGEVWMAIEPASYRRVAIKILSPALTRDEVFIERFRREVSIVASLSHPNIVTAFDAGTDRNIHYLAINYIEGSDLEQMLREGTRFDEQEALSIILVVANALKYAWDSKGIVHRDLKPSNIMIDKEGIVYLMDLGVSRTVTSRKSSITNTGQFIGTPHFMSPEQARSQADLDFASDIYSLGCTLHNLLARRPPFEADSTVEILNKHIKENPRSARAFNPSISLQCESLLSIMMAKDRRKRQGSWSEVIGDITRVMEGQMPASMPTTSDSRYLLSSDDDFDLPDITEVVDNPLKRRRSFPKYRNEPVLFLIAGGFTAIFVVIVWWIIFGF